MVSFLSHPNARSDSGIWATVHAAAARQGVGERLAQLTARQLAGVELLLTRKWPRLRRHTPPQQGERPGKGARAARGLRDNGRVLRLK